MRRSDSRLSAGLPATRIIFTSFSVPWNRKRRNSVLRREKKTLRISGRTTVLSFSLRLRGMQKTAVSSDNRFGPGYTDWKWDGGAEFKIHVEPGKYWDLEIRIPRRNPGMLSGDSIMANVCRHRVVDGEKNSYDTWSPFVTGSNRKISAYGELLFQAPEDNNLIDTPDFDKPVRGKRFIGKWCCRRMRKSSGREALQLS